MSAKIISLEPYLKKIEELSKVGDFDLVRGFVSQDFQIPQVNCEAEKLDDLFQFFSLASKLNASVLILELINISREDIDSAILHFEASEEIAKVKKLKQGLARVGLPGLLRLSFFGNQPSAVFQIELETELNSFLHIEDEDNDEDGDFDDVTIPKDKEIEQFSLELANDRNFQAATNDTQRQLIAKRIFAAQSEKYDYFLIDRIVQEAMAIYEMDIRPSLESVLSEKAEKLLQDGLSKKDIAKKLGITLGRLSKLI